MTASDYLKALHDAGFTTKPLWSAKEVGEDYVIPSVSAHVVYAADGHLLTSIVIRPFDVDEVAVYFCQEDNSIQSDIEELRGIWSRQISRRAKRPA